MKYMILSSIIALGFLGSLCGMQPKQMDDKYQRIIKIIKKSRLVNPATAKPLEDQNAEKARREILEELSDLEDDQARLDARRLEEEERAKENRRFLERANELAQAVQGLEQAAAISLQQSQVQQGDISQNPQGQ